MTSPADLYELGLVFNPRQLKRARILSGFTQETFANALGVHPLTVWHWETPRGEYRYNPRPDKLRRIARLCKVKPESFYDWPNGDRELLAAREQRLGGNDGN